MERKANRAHPPFRFPMVFYRAAVALLLLALLVGCLSVPFAYETETLWYKTGIDRIMLISGQLAGLFTLFLLVLQIALSLKGKFLQKIFGTAKLVQWHRRNGLVIAFSAICHVLLVLAPEGLGNIPFGKKYWPEMTGEGLLLLLLLTVLSSHFRSALHLSYTAWRTVHRPLGYMIPVIALIHVVFVSDSFKEGLPRASMFFVFACLALSVIAIKTTRGSSTP